MVLRDREPVKRSVDPPRGDSRRPWLAAEYSLDHAACHFHWVQPMEKVLRAINLQSSALRHLLKTCLSVTGYVVVYGVVIGPKRIKRRYCNQQLAVGCEKLQRISQRGSGIG